jgi:hypothetical protein
MAPKKTDMGDGKIDWVASHEISEEFVREREAALRAQQEVAEGQEDTSGEDADDEDQSTSEEESEAGEPAQTSVSDFNGYTGVYGLLTMLCRRLPRAMKRSPSRRRFLRPSRPPKATRSLRSRSKRMMRSLPKQRSNVGLSYTLLDTIVLILLCRPPMEHSSNESPLRRRVEKQQG